MSSFMGLAVARTTNGPVGVGTQTLTVTVRHVEGDTHHHIGNETTPRCAGGEVPTSGTGMRPKAYFDAWLAIVESETTGTQ